VNSERDNAIVAHLKDGKRYADVAFTFGLSITRVSQLAAMNGITNNRPSQIERQKKVAQIKLNEEATQRLMQEWSDE
jgi:hypothetical protein